jgi:hypothetical protein
MGWTHTASLPSSSRQMGVAMQNGCGSKHFAHTKPPSSNLRSATGVPAHIITADISSATEHPSHIKPSAALDYLFHHLLHEADHPSHCQYAEHLMTFPSNKMILLDVVQIGSDTSVHIRQEGAESSFQ